MEIRRSTLLAALASLTTGQLAYAHDYSWTLLSASWRTTGLRQEDLRELLRYCVGEGYMELHGDEQEASYRVTAAGEQAIAESRWFPWTRWRDDRTLGQLRMRGRYPSKDGSNRRDADPMPIGLAQH
ncbi:hypothetical protein D0B54_12595 [Solimonas sp. K1W22B-7]|uniref:hypothetical protein n=1 Tax=Solimonas sp. K1W22B-7 TaxID=2303331 RepID=UPI000E330D94|nr:hypothetical protein [Solimonas sp. K1W22B-7]AXQ29477.1 hypothetical protein D0B54_12595 [Solimonas sp. K1W22B-7]